MTNIAIIPARGGSKRIPGKNIKSFNGKPIISYAITAALNSGLFSQVVVSTDDDAIADIANSCGAKTPFIRPRKLADDYTPTVPVISHAILACEQLGWKIDYSCCIYPCNPFIQVEDLRASLKLLVASKAEYCFPITKFSSPIQRALRRDVLKGTLEPFDRSNEMARSQDLEPAYYDAGQFYFGLRDAWIRQKNIHSNGVGLVIPNWRVVDIDNMEDWLRSEILYKTLAEINNDFRVSHGSAK